MINSNKVMMGNRKIIKNKRYYKFKQNNDGENQTLRI